MTPSEDRPRITVFGATGRMGRAVLSVVMTSSEVSLAGAVTRPGHRALGKAIGSVEFTEEIPEETDVLVDFSTPGGVQVALAVCRAREIPFVSGTTGLPHDLAREVEATANEIPLVWEPNFALGMHVLHRLVGEASRVLGERAGVEIVETHHAKKADAPSGTARALAAQVLKTDAGHQVVTGRGEESEPRRDGDVGIHSVRLGNVVGEHLVSFGLTGERIELVHRAYNRRVFARGAVEAARFVVGRSSGRYDLDDVLGLGPDEEEATPGSSSDPSG